MVYLIKNVIFHGKRLNYQRVVLFRKRGRAPWDILVTDHIKSRNKTLDHPMNMWVCLEIALFKRCFPYVNGLV